MASKPASASRTNKLASSHGAPSQLKQGSRKGKRAWRKNVDIRDVDEGLEGLRVEERVTGSTLRKKKDEDLFLVDLRGDERVRKSLPKYSKSRLTSTKIINERSAVPAVFSKNTSASSGKRKLSREDKERLLRMGKRQRRGPLNSVLDPTEFGGGSAILEVSEAVKNSGKSDIWAEDVPVEEKEGLEYTRKAQVKPPNPNPLHGVIEVPAVAEPHVGTSYNPPAAAHQELLWTAHDIETKRIREGERLKAWSEKMELARTTAIQERQEGVPIGMIIGDGEQDANSHELDAGEDAPVVKKAPERKTSAQKKKAAKLRAEKRALAEKVAKKRMLASISLVKSLRSVANKNLSANEKMRAQRRLAMQDKMRRGLAGQKLGRHKVQEGEVDVQLGEELSESLRALKPEGNLFRDRFLSLQHRALIEPRTPVIPGRRRTKIKEYEKHAWKRFE